MKRFLLAAGLALASVAGTPAMAAKFQTAPAGPAADGSLSFNFGNSGGIAKGAFSDVFNFVFPASGITSASITSTFTAKSNNLKFTSATLNGEALTLGDGPGLHFGSIAFLPTGTTAQLIINGTSPGIAGSYSGNVTFTTAVPEPATWALMIGGFGLVGGTMRQRRAKSALAAA